MANGDKARTRPSKTQSNPEHRKRHMTNGDTGKNVWGEYSMGLEGAASMVLHRGFSYRLT